jgi:hypothetical protein
MRKMHVLGRKRIREARGVEALAFVAYRNDQLAGFGTARRGELHVHHLPLVAAVAVLDRVDHRLAHGDADPVHRVLVEPDLLAQMITDHLDEIQHVECAAELEPDDRAVGGHAVTGALIPLSG